MRPKIFVSREIPEAGLKLLRKECDVEINLDKRALSKNELMQKISGKDAIITLFDDKVDKQVLSSNPNLRIVSNYAVGFNNVDLKFATEKQIPVTNTPDVSTPAIADFTIGLILSVSRRIIEADKYVRDGKYKQWSPTMLLGTGMSGKTLGIVGLGSTGKAVAERAKSFGMKIIYYDVLRNKNFEQEHGLSYSSLKDLLKESDFVTLHVPLLPQTKHLIGVKELNMMKRTSYLINTARGKVVDQEALIHALKHKVIAGAALDVFENEPKLKLGEKKIGNLILSPHIASATKEARDEMAIIAAKNVLNVLKGKKPLSQVNKKVKVGLGYKHPFYMVNGKIIKNKEELISVLEKSSDHDYWYHANNERNDFVNWVNDVLKDEKLAGRLRKAKNRAGAIRILKAKPVKKAKKVKSVAKKKSVKKTKKKVKTAKRIKKKAKKTKKKVRKVKRKAAKKSKPKKKAAKKIVKKTKKKKSVRKTSKKKTVKKARKKKPLKKRKTKKKNPKRRSKKKTLKKGRKRRKR